MRARSIRIGRRGAAVAILLALLAALLAGYVFLHRPAPRLTLSISSYSRLAGWQDDDVADAILPFRRSCGELLKKEDGASLDGRTTSADFGTVAEWRAACGAADRVPAHDTVAARLFFETQFQPVLAGNNGDPEGLFTGYFEITLDGSRHRGGPFQTALYRRPPEPKRYSRAEIEKGALAGQGLELLWVDSPVDAFFLEIQGSGRVRLREGGLVRVGYDGGNGHPYVAVGRLLVERRIMPRERVTMAAIRRWMIEHPQEGVALRRENPSYVFFREIRGDGPIGAERVALSPGRSLAVDRAFIPLGVPIWLEGEERFRPGSYRRLVVAQDTGGAIKGPVRGDLFWGHGEAAAEGAGGMNARGRYWLLLPKTVAGRLPQ